MKCAIIASLIFLCFPLSLSVRSQTPLKVLVDLSEGGSSSPRLYKKFANYLKAQNCVVNIEHISHYNQQSFDLLFSSIKLPEHTLKLINSYQVMQIKREKGHFSQAAIIVRQKTHINDLQSLSGVHFAFVHPSSITGFADQKTMLQHAGVELQHNQTVFTDNHIGALSLLLHKDVFAIGVDYLFAEQWVKSNGLKILATGEPQAVGGLYAKRSSRPAQLNPCLVAIKALTRNRKPGRSILKLFPDWIVNYQ
ncbi:PhnD/SsuA/transferrin family substrate-binding protein [Aliikangiella sp. IMCC44359]|uniref:PhnD/SsuA/transferrin family substrate-binding protein n=1 Tax=Aliikangiella sp. IMCC44359 TaxID=3459125 RepID=UPI00403A9773